MAVVELVSGLVCPSWCRADMAVPEGWLHGRLLWEAELVRGVDFAVQLMQVNGGVPWLMLGRFPAAGEVHLSVVQMRQLWDAADEALRVLGVAVE